MALRRRPRTVEEDDINMTPMLDIVFIMLIFFIVTASFTKESGIDVNRPNAATAEVQERGNILVAITDTGQFWIDNRQVDGGRQRHVDWTALVELHTDSELGNQVLDGISENVCGQMGL